MCMLADSANLCVNSAVSMRYLLSKLLQDISSYLKPITIVIDDVQFADPASLLLVGICYSVCKGLPSLYYVTMMMRRARAGPSIYAVLNCHVHVGANKVDIVYS